MKMQQLATLAMLFAAALTAADPATLTPSPSPYEHDYLIGQTHVYLIYADPKAWGGQPTPNDQKGVLIEVKSEDLRIEAFRVTILYMQNGRVKSQDIELYQSKQFTGYRVMTGFVWMGTEPFTPFRVQVRELHPTVDFDLF